jgi:hypothetical protein
MRCHGPLLGLALALSVAASGCGQSLPAAYTEALETWTQEQNSWENMESRLQVRATLKTEPYRRAYADAYAQIFALDQESREELLAVELEEGERDYVVFVALYAPEDSWTRLSPQYGVWEVRLENSSGAFARPRAVRKLNTNNPTWRRLLPDLTPHEHLFAVHFARKNEEGLPLAAPGESIELVIAGAPAQVRFRWTLP